MIGIQSIVGRPLLGVSLNRNPEPPSRSSDNQDLNSNSNRVSGDLILKARFKFKFKYDQIRSHLILGASRSRGSGRIWLGPSAQSLDEAQWLAPTEEWRPAIWPQCCSLGTNSKTVPISKKCRFPKNKNVSFSKNDIRLFFQKLGNFQNYHLIN